MIGLLACEPSHDSQAENELRTAIARASFGAPIRADTVLLKPEWDRLLVFAPYTPDSVEKAALGQAWISQLSMEQRDDINLLALTKGGVLVDWLEFPRSWGDFESVKTPVGGFAPNATLVKLPACSPGEFSQVEIRGQG